MIDWQAIKELWPFGAAIVGHLVRTETSRAVIASRLKSIEDSAKQDHDDTREMLREIRTDIKSLLRKDP